MSEKGSGQEPHGKYEVWHKEGDGYVPVAHDSPFAGHGSETSNTQLVIKTGFDRLATYFNSGDVPACREFVIDGTTGVTAGVPTTGC